MNRRRTDRSLSPLEHSRWRILLTHSLGDRLQGPLNITAGGPPAGFVSHETIRFSGALAFGQHIEGTIELSLARSRPVATGVTASLRGPGRLDGRLVAEPGRPVRGGGEDRNRFGALLARCAAGLSRRVSTPVGDVVRASTGISLEPNGSNGIVVRLSAIPRHRLFQDPVLHLGMCSEVADAVRTDRFGARGVSSAA